MVKKLFVLSWVMIAYFIAFPTSTTASFGGYPKIYNLWGDNSYGADNTYFASFNLYAMYSDGDSDSVKTRADAIHALNPNTKILITADIIPAHQPGSGLDSQPQFWSAVKGTPDYACIIRDASGNILRDNTYNAAYNNLADKYCRDYLVSYFIRKWNQSGGHFDGWQVDQAGDTGVVWQLGNNIDLNVDGIADDPVTADSQYVAGMRDIFARLREAIPSIIIDCNDSPPSYSQWVNGRLFEMDLKRYLDKESTKPWFEILKDWSNWTDKPDMLIPNTTNVMNSTEGILLSTKYTFQNIRSAIKPEMMAEYSSDYNRMRFGLASAMLAGVMYSYDLGPYLYGVNWWYDEYGTRGQISSLGYLGQPIDTKTLINQLTTANQVVNGSFTDGSDPWFTSTSGTSVVSSLTVENGTAHIHLPGATSGWSLLRQNYFTVEEGKYYTLSFKARANNFRLGGVRIQRAGGAWDYMTAGTQLRFYSDWTEYHLPMKAVASGTNGTLSFDTGISAGDIYFDDIKFQEGVEGVWQRHFENGTVLLNESPIQQTVPLDKTYQKLTGNQAPLYAKKIDDNKASKVGSWTETAASFDQWGTTVQTITAPNSTASLTYTFSVPYSGEYEVLAWVAPNSVNSSNVSVDINGTVVTLNQTTGALGWHSLGRFNFNETAVVIIKPLGTDRVVADAIKINSIARYNDGSLVNQVTLQPDDAIILLNTTQTGPSPSPTPTAHPGDANNDTHVDGIDYVIWLSHYNQSVTGIEVGDFNNSGKVDGVDYMVWLNNYGK